MDKVTALLSMELPTLSENDLKTIQDIGQTIALLEDIENAGGVPSLDQDTIDQLNQAKAELVALMDKNLPYLSTEELDAVTNTEKTLSLLSDIVDAGGVPSLDQDTIDQLTQAKAELVALMDKNLPYLSTEELDAVTNTEKTLSLLSDIVEAGGVPSLDQDTIDQLTQAKAELVALMDKDLPSLSTEELDAVTNTEKTLSLLSDIVEAGGVPSLDQDTIDQLTQAKAELVALMDKDLPSLSTEELDAVTNTEKTLSLLSDIVEAGGVPFFGPGHDRPIDPGQGRIGGPYGQRPALPLYRGT